MLERLQARLAAIDLASDRALVGFLARCLFKPDRVSECAGIRHIVIYRVGNIGDIVVAIPAMQSVRAAFPDAVITLLTSSGGSDLPGAAEVLAAFPEGSLVNRIVPYFPRDIKSPVGLSRLRSEVLGETGAVDLFIDLPVTLQNFRRALQDLFMAKMLGAERAIGFAPMLPEIFRQAFARQMPEHIPKTTDWLAAIVEPLLPQIEAGLNKTGGARHHRGSGSRMHHGYPQGQENYFSGNGDFRIEAFFLASETWLSSLGLDLHRPILAVNAGAKLTIKRWPPEAFRETIRQVTETCPELQVVLLGGPGETALNTEITDGLIPAADSENSGVFNLAGRLTLAETWQLLAQAAMVLSNDTGVMHMAGLLGRPVFVPMSGQWPAPLWHPPGETLVEFRKSVSCAPCFRDTCPFPRQACLTEISPAEVAEALIAAYKG